MISPKKIQEKASRKFKDFLLHEINVMFNKPVGSFFPLIIRGDTGNVNDDLLKRQKEIQLLISGSKNTTGKGYLLELEDVNSRKNGVQTNIKRIFFENKNDFIKFVKEESSYESFLKSLEIIKNEMELTEFFFYEWSTMYINDLCKSVEEDFWINICMCAKWLDSNYGSNLFIREIPLPVHTKFIENNKALIKSLTKKNNSDLGFEETFGLKGKPTVIRIRSLDNNNPLHVEQFCVTECSITVSDLNKLPEKYYKNLEKIFIVENEMVFLTFPKVNNAVCIWGHGFTVNVLKGVEWLQQKKIFYFGDLDEHGFEILSTFRTHFLNINSFCMTKDVLQKYENFRVKGATLSGGIVPKHLTEEELEVFMMLRNGSINHNRLEQERIDNKSICLEIEKLGWGWCKKII